VLHGTRRTRHSNVPTNRQESKPFISFPVRQRSHHVSTSLVCHSLERLQSHDPTNSLVSRCLAIMRDEGNPWANSVARNKHTKQQSTVRGFPVSGGRTGTAGRHGESQIGSHSSLLFLVVLSMMWKMFKCGKDDRHPQWESHEAPTAKLAISTHARFKTPSCLNLCLSNGTWLSCCSATISFTNDHTLTRHCDMQLPPPAAAVRH